jgi:hypothetical protein
MNLGRMASAGLKDKSETVGGTKKSRDDSQDAADTSEAGVTDEAYNKHRVAGPNYEAPAENMQIKTVLEVRQQHSCRTQERKLDT